jgi:predicted PurR-regulated permease PerM
LAVLIGATLGGRVGADLGTFVGALIGIPVGGAIQVVVREVRRGPAAAGTEVEAPGQVSPTADAV